MSENGKPLVSIITTFFNEENYLGRCLLSIAKQTYANLEVILVNDGSTDASLEISEKYYEKFNNCKVFTIKNAGHAEARNVGVFHATGVFLTFLDADDTFEPRMIEAFVNVMVQQNVDLVDGNYTHYNENYTILSERKWPQTFANIHTTKELVPELYKGNLQPVVWAKMFRTDLAKQIKFDKGLWFDDWPFTLEYLHKANSVSFVKESLFRVYGRRTSITRRTLEPKRISDTNRLLELTNSIHARYNSYPDFKYASFKLALNYYVDNFLISEIDKKVIRNPISIHQSFIENIQKFRIAAKQENVKIKLTDEAILFLLSQKNRVTIKLFRALMSILKRSRLNTIKKIKQLDH